LDDFARNIKKKRNVNDFSFAHFAQILLLHYLVKCRSRSLAFTAMNSHWVLSVAHALAQKIILKQQNHCKFVTYLTASLSYQDLDIDE